jgi:hypothetical protein
MKSKPVLTLEQIEQKLPRWEKWLYACGSAAVIMLAHALVKAIENTALTGALFFIEGKAGITPQPDFFNPYPCFAYSVLHEN